MTGAPRGWGGQGRRPGREDKGGHRRARQQTNERGRAEVARTSAKPLSIASYQSAAKAKAMTGFSSPTEGTKIKTQTDALILREGGGSIARRESVNSRIIRPLGVGLGPGVKSLKTIHLDQNVLPDITPHHSLQLLHRILTVLPTLSLRTSSWRPAVLSQRSFARRKTKPRGTGPGRGPF